MPQSQLEEFDKFFTECFRKTVRAVMAAGASFEDASDAAQEAMGLAADAFGELRYPKAWVYRVALRIYHRQRVRDDKRREREQRAASRPRVLEQSESEAFRSAVVAILESLPPVQRTVLAYSMDGWSQVEIAEALNKPVATVRTNLCHARKAMRAGLKKGDWNV